MRTLLIPAALLVTACSNPAPTASPENLVMAGCEAAAANKLEDWRPLTITAADFILKDQGQSSPFRQKNSYAGSQLKPEEIARQEEEFRRLAGEVAGASCDGVQARGVETRERMDGGSIEVNLYAAVINGQALASPLFEVVAWSNERHRLLGLKFTDEYAEPAPEWPDADAAAEMPEDTSAESEYTP